MENLVQMLVSGIAYGCIYCLVAIEYTLLFNASGLINFGHDKFILIGAYIFGVTFMQQIGLPYYLSIPLAFIAMSLIGTFTAVTIFNPLRNMRSPIYAVFGTLMLGKAIGELVRIIWSPIPYRLEGFVTGVYKIGNIVFAKVFVLIIAASIVLLILQRLLFGYTKLGKSMRCVQQDKVAAELMGINVSRSIVITVCISAIICTVIGILIIPIFNIDNAMSGMIGLKGFSAGVVGGLGTVQGAIVGGLFIGIAENLFIMFGPSIYKDVVSFVLLIFFLIIKPKGIMAKKVR
ncbi:MAG: branched-chain amino acid ABC transporter permease [Christensenellales bacterium]